jgi:hypothetical protein
MHSDQEDKLFGKLDRLAESLADAHRKLDELRGLAPPSAAVSDGHSLPPTWDNTVTYTPSDQPHTHSFTVLTPGGVVAITPQASQIADLEKILASADYQEGKVAVNIEADGKVVTTPVVPEEQAKPEETGVGDSTEQYFQNLEEPASGETGHAPHKHSKRKS